MRAWGIEAVWLTYAPVGFGDHHWTAGDADGRRWFVTLAEVSAPVSTVSGGPADGTGTLRAALDTAAALDGLGFVVAPVRTAGGASVLPFGPRHALSVFPYMTGESGRFGQELGRDERQAVIELLARLHTTPPPETTPAHDPGIPGRDPLERTLLETDRPWHGGPFAEPAREAVSRGLGVLRRRLAEFDRLAAAVRGRPVVVTHGEPHPGNLMRVDGRLLLVDWDTVGLAVPERDLWLAASGQDDLDRYAELTGHRPDPPALTCYRLRWALNDVAEFLAWFRAPHEHTADLETAWTGFTGTLDQLAET
ncbi:phosphotransferase [Nonomuraea sp. NN258]|nr:phosphotransferase [Nonomuraea antri]